ncbi:MAG TPA: glycoside hydrolase family 2 TIM barrel-domain containing protein [Candidatus Limnocylindrales bacterium]|nr:glycoside hydrolase family 2 TIM barrel-domain containing protein [Candidatus Limnocylindrales bacterium]
MSLAGDWEFQIDPSGELDVATIRPDRTIRVPQPWQAAFPDLRRYAGYAWYRRSFEVEGGLQGGDLRLRFGAVDYWCEVFLNGRRLGDHEGGYTPFEFGLRDLLRDGSNELAVRVFDPVQSAVVSQRWPDVERHRAAATHGPPFVAADVPHGKQDWYVNTGGIWQNVTLTPRPATWIEGVRVDPDVDRAGVTVDLTLAGDIDRIAGRLLRIEVMADGAVAAAADLPVEPGRSLYSTIVDVPDPRPWTLDKPFLYELDASLEVDGRQTHTATRFGMRSFGSAAGQFILNGEPIYLLGVLDQDFYPQTVSSIPSPEVLRDEFLKVKALGFNCLRCHIKLPAPAYLDLADELGLLVWEELPSWRTFWSKGSLDPARTELPQGVRDRVEGTLEAAIERDFNHPSLVIRALVNEDWGTALPLRADDRAWLADLYDLAKRLDPGRLVVDNSPSAAPWGTSFHVKSDIDDFHLYATIPEGAATFDDAVGDLALRPSWTYSPHGDARRRGDEPIVLSEFGTWALPRFPDPGAASGREPDWFDVRAWGGGWEQEPGSPSGVLRRFRDLGLDSIWADYDALAAATQRHQVAALRYQVETVRRRPSIGGYVVTELTDTYWESNGLLDFHRRVKAPLAEIAAFNAPSVLVASPDRHSYRSGDEAVITVVLSGVGACVEEGSRLEWRVVDGERVASRDLDARDVAGTTPIGEIALRMPQVDALSYLPVSIAVVGPDGRPTAASELRLAVVPEGVPAAVRETLVVGADAGGASSDALADRLASEGYRVTQGPAPHDAIAVSDTPTAELLDWVRAGGRLLFLAERRSPFFWVQDRGGSSEGWITSFSWIRPSAHERLRNVINPLGLEFAEVAPHRTIAGLPFESASIHGDVLAGRIVGWVHHPTAHTVRFGYGRGRVVMTTFRLGSTFGRDPIATAMVHDLLDHLVDAAAAPTLTAQGGTAAEYADRRIDTLAP